MDQHPQPKRTIVYIDGFNLYYGSLKANPALRWLNLEAMCERLLPGRNIRAIKYFTAMVKPRGGDEGQALRQQVYVRALATTPIVQVIPGYFQTKPKKAHLVKSIPGYDRMDVEIYRTDEKGSDVNLASHLLVDGFKQTYELAAVITGDSDLVAPIHMARKELHKTVFVFNPRARDSRSLSKAATKYFTIDLKLLADCQFPDELKDAHGTMHRPATWKAASIDDLTRKFKK